MEGKKLCFNDTESLKSAGYEALEKLFEGETSLVYRARKNADGQIVVIKVPRIDSSASTLSAMHEFSISSNIHSNAIIRVFDMVPIEEHGMGIVMEDIGGVCLRTYLHQLGRPLYVQEFLPLAIQISNALVQLHKEKVIHCDIKPSNLIYNPTTGIVKLADLNAAKRLVFGLSVTAFEGTFNYVCPEMTGRMGKLSIDQRADLYSLGISFYELLTGNPPFNDRDFRNIVRSHLTVIAPPVSNSFPVPVMIDCIIGKLIKKMPDDRYQSAWGLKYDLEKCWDLYQKTGAVSIFQLGEHDIPSHFQIPNKVYGREAEVALVAQCYNKFLSFSDKECVMILGPAGTGKTAFALETLQKMGVPPRNCAYGKCDISNQMIPYKSLVESFREVVNNLQSLAVDRLQEIKSKMVSSLGPNGQLVISVLPELEKIIGPQPPVPELPLADSEFRFCSMFLGVVRCLATKENPLVIVLDDLQWCDSRSLNLLRLLLSDPQVKMFIIITSRELDNNSTSEIEELVKNLRDSNLHTQELHLSNLKVDSVSDIICDIIHCTKEKAYPLAEVVMQKTKVLVLITIW